MTSREPEKPLDVTRPMNAKTRRIVRRRWNFRGGHSTKCRYAKGHACSCAQKDWWSWAERERAFEVVA